MIQITDRFYINANTNCYTLQEKTIIQDENSKNYGKEVFRDLGYYTTIESCLEGVLKVTTREFISKDTINSLKELQQEVKNFTEYLKSLNLDV